MVGRSDSSRIQWLGRLRDRVSTLPLESASRPYYSQRGGSNTSGEVSLEELVRRIRAVVNGLNRKSFFAEVLGYDCVDSPYEKNATEETELETRLGKGRLASLAGGEWTFDDLCDYVEMFHDLAARPKTGFFHDYMGCGFHPTSFAKASGQTIYRWAINNVFAQAHWKYALADDGEDIGWITHALSVGSELLISEVIASSEDNEIPHAVSLFRSRGSSRETKRSAILSLAGILERDRDLVKELLQSKDEGALFEIANKFDLRHRKPGQREDYDIAFLDWIFYWYLATAHLVQQVKRDRRRS